MKTSSKLIPAVLAVSLMGTPLTALAVDELNVVRGLSAAGAPLAVHGYDPVAYFTQGAPVLGSDAITVVHEGAAYRFASEAHKRLFEAGPERYLPQFGGYCAYGTALGKKFDGDPRLWTIHEGKLYLNLNPDILATFRENVPGNVAKAERNWMRIEHVAVDAL